MISKSGKPFFNNYTIKVVTKDEKGLIDVLQTDISEVTYRQKLKRMYNRVRNASDVTPPALRKRFIRLGLLFYGRK